MKQLILFAALFIAIGADAQLAGKTLIRGGTLTGTFSLDTTSTPNGVTSRGRYLKGLDSIRAVIQTAAAATYLQSSSSIAWGKITGAPSFLTVETNPGAVPVTRTITINGVTQTLEANRTFTINATAGVNTFNGRSGPVTPQELDYASYYAKYSHNHDNADILWGSTVNMNGMALSNYAASVAAITGTSYTLVPTDKGKVLEFTNTAPITVVVPTGLGAGFTATIKQAGTGQITFVASGSTVNNRQGHTKTAGQLAIVAIVPSVTLNTFTLAGDTTN